MSMKKENKKTAGMTLVELLIAIGVLVVVTAPILGLYVMGTRISAASYKLTSASCTAQLRMEELVGLTERELRGGAIENPLTLDNYDYNGFRVIAVVEFNNVVFAGVYYPALARAVVTVYDDDGTVLCVQENYLNIAQGGVT